MQTAFDNLFEKHVGNIYFWHFVDEFATTLDAPLADGTIVGAFKIIEEADRQWQWLKENRPAYLDKLSTQKSGTPIHLVGIVDWSIANDVFPRHFAAKPHVSPILFDVWEKRTEAYNKKACEDEAYAKIREGIENLKQPSPVTPPATVAEATREEYETALLLAGIDPATHMSPLDASEMKAKLQGLYEDHLGRVVRVSEWGNGDYLGGTLPDVGSDGKPFNYELVMIVETSPGNIGVRGNHDDYEATWDVKIMNGPYRGQSGFIHAPAVSADRSVDPQWLIATGTTIDTVEAARLSDDDLKLLIVNDCLEMSGKEKLVTWAHAYFQDTDDMHQVSFDPPIKVTIDTMTQEAILADIRLDSDAPGIDVADCNIDFVSDDPQTKNYRACFSDGPAYLSDGRVEKLHIYPLDTVFEPAIGSEDAVQPRM